MFCSYCGNHDGRLIVSTPADYGAAIGRRKIGTWGDIACFSFYPTKNLGALGDGGALVTSRAEWAQRARMLRQYGWRERYVSELAGMNTRLDEVQAAVLRAKLPYLDRENARRREIAARYNAALQSTPLRLPQAGIDRLLQHGPDPVMCFVAGQLLATRRQHRQFGLAPLVEPLAKDESIGAG